MGLKDSLSIMLRLPAESSALNSRKNRENIKRGNKEKNSFYVKEQNKESREVGPAPNLLIASV